MEKDIKQKVFNFGIYGSQVSKHPNSFIDSIRDKPWVEILSPAQLQAFRSNFSLAPVNTPVPVPVPGDYVVRMNLQAWRAHLLGPDFITSNRFYFDIGDYLVRNPGYANWSLLRSQYGIDPKTMHYVCKRMKERGAVEEKKEGLETFIRLGTSGAPSEHPQKQVLGPEAPADTAGLVFYKRIPLIKQIAIHARDRINGLGTRDLKELVGVSQKASLKHLQDLCSMPSFKMVNSIEHGHTTFRVFSVENLSERNRKKLETMKNENPQAGDPVLTARDRQEALKLLAERHGHFVLSRQVFEEIGRMTGYPYSIDRKNLISNAKIAGLKIFKIGDSQTASRYVIAQPTYDDTVVGFYQPPPEKNREEGEFFKKIRSYFMEFSRFVISDNGYSEIPEEHYGILYDFISEGNSSSNNNTVGNNTPPETDTTTAWKQFDHKTIMKMEFTKFFKITKITKPLFLFNCAFELLQTVPLCRMDSLFMRNIDSSPVDENIYKAIEEAGNMRMEEVVPKLPLDGQEVIRVASNPFRYLPRLEKLKEMGLIDMKVDEEGRIYVRMLRRGPSAPPPSGRAIAQGGLWYNRRLEFVEGLRDVKREEFWEKAEAMSRRIFGRGEQRIMKKSISWFMRKEKLPGGKGVRRETRGVLERKNRRLYIKVKKILILGGRLDFEKLSEAKNSEIEEVLDYMTGKRIVSGYRSLLSLERVKGSPSFMESVRGEGEQSRAPAGEIPPTARDFSNKDYFKLIFPKIHSVVKAHGSIDMEQLVSKLRYFEEFEIEAVLEQFKEKFTRREVDEFVFISISDIKDPFDFS